MSALKSLSSKVEAPELPASANQSHVFEKNHPQRYITHESVCTRVMLRPCPSALKQRQDGRMGTLGKWHLSPAEAV